MSNHFHLIVKAKNENLQDIIRDFKKFTVKKIYKAIQENPKESRKAWLLKTLTFQDKIWFWEEGYHGVEINSLEMYESKVNYIHNNPTIAEIVESAEDYLLSSARDFLGLRNGKIEMTFV